MKPKRKRNKPIKSCSACRTKKQKCDHVRPQCYQCRIRGIECVYLSNKADADSAKTAPKHGRLQDEQSSFQESCSVSATTLNPLVGAKFLFRKEDRWIACGVTSMRTIFHLHCSNKFNDHFMIAWNKLKQERLKWKQKNNYSSLSEWTLLAVPDIVRSGESLIDAVCRILPSYEEIHTHLGSYFTGQRHRTFEIVDPKKAMQDFENCFIMGTKIDGVGHHRVVSLVSTQTHNFHCMGVIIEILRTTFYKDVPKELDIFSGYLSSAASLKSFSIEKLQCVMLRAINVDFTAMTGGDFSRAYMFVQMACSLAIDLGFTSDINILITATRKKYLENLWWWILYMDVQVSFNLGVPLLIRDISAKKLLLPSSGTKQDRLFRKTILILRETMDAIYDKESVPNIANLILRVKTFIGVNFKPLSFYMTAANYDFTEAREIHSLLFLLTVIANLSNIQKYYFHESSPETFNTTVQISFTSLYIAITVLKCYYKMDKDDQNYCFSPASIQLPQHLQLGTWITYHTFGRIIYEIYGMLFSALQGSLSTPEHVNELHVCDFSIGSLNINKEHFVSLKAVSSMLNSIIDMLYALDCRELLLVIKRSYCFLLVLSLERVSRTMLLNGFTTKESLEIQDPNDTQLQSDKTNEGKNSCRVPGNLTGDFFWDSYGDSMDNWIDNDLEACFSEWFGNFSER